MDQSLTLVLPAHNAQTSLARQVSDLLDLLPELTSRFEILIIDAGSTDHTEEVAHELVLQYPQVRLVRSPGQRGTAATVQIGLQMSQSDVVIVQDEQHVRPSQLRRLWELRHDQQLVMAQADSDAVQPVGSVDPGVIDRLFTWGTSLKHNSGHRPQGAIHMIRRQAVHQLNVQEPLTVETC